MPKTTKRERRFAQAFPAKPQNAFAFLRGAAAVMASDLAQQPTAGALVQACGHLMNFGAFSTPEDNILLMPVSALKMVSTTDMNFDCITHPRLIPERQIRRHENWRYAAFARKRLLDD